jgi:glycosyltransferase involved in cell wall biosynthesis
MATVSAVIPVRNGANYLAEAIESCLRQTFPVHELFVVDDGSTDGTPDIARGFGERVRYIRQDWSGTATALNAGIRQSAGEFLAFLDHDDLWLEDKIERQIACFRHNEPLEAVFGHVQQFISPELKPLLEGKIQIPSAPQPGIQISAMLVRRAAWQRIGPFESGKDAFAFPAWYARAVDMNFKTEVLPETVARRRIHNSNYVRQERERLNEQMLDLLHQKIARRRRAD